MQVHWLIWLVSFSYHMVPTVLENSLNFGFSLNTPWKQICPWKVLEYGGPSLKFQFVVLEFFVLCTCILNWKFEWIQQMKRHKSQFFQKHLARFARSSLQVKYFSSFSLILIYNSRTIVIISFLSQEYPQVFMYIICFNVSICSKIMKMGSLHSCCGMITKLMYPPELSRIAGFCTNAIKIFGGMTPYPLSSRIVWHCIISIILQIM